VSFIEQFRDALLRYAMSFEICTHEAEEVIPEVVFSMFQYLQPEGSLRAFAGGFFASCSAARKSVKN